MSSYIAVDLGGTNIRAAHYTADGVLLSRATCSTFGENRDEPVLERILATVREVMPADSLNGDEMRAIGIGVPGPLNPRTGVVLRAPNLPGWINYPLKQKIEAQLKLPTTIGNDANLAALAEWRFGAGRGHDDMLYLTISTGIGGGVISGGRLITGATGIAAELGHVVIAPHGRLCSCAHHGHLEAYASGAAIAHTARMKLKTGAASIITDYTGGQSDSVTAQHVGEAARLGDVLAIRLLAEAGTYLGWAIADFLHIFNPSIVILGGGVASNVGDLLLEPARAAVRQRAISDRYHQDCRIVQAQLGGDAGLLGALALAVESHPA